MDTKHDFAQTYRLLVARLGDYVVNGIQLAEKSTKYVIMRFRGV